MLTGRFDREGFDAASTSIATDGGPIHSSTRMSGDWFQPPGIPGFELRAAITSVTGEAQPVTLEVDCIDETVCLSGAIPGRAEVFVRIVGPRPNGRLWPTLVKLTTSSVDLSIRQTSTGIERHYLLEAARPGFDELNGLFDRLGFPP